MFFRHSPEIWRSFPSLVPGVILVHEIRPEASVEPAMDRFRAIAASRLAQTTEGEFPEIRAWRQAFSKMGLKPTGHRCASEALLRRFRQEGSPPSIHPIVDLCNAASMAFAIPIAVFDVGLIAEGIEVRHAGGDEVFLTFGGLKNGPSRARSFSLTWRGPRIPGDGPIGKAGFRRSATLPDPSFWSQKDCTNPRRPTWLHCWAN